MALVDHVDGGPFVLGSQVYVRAPREIDFRGEEPLEEKVGETKRHLDLRTLLYLLVRDLPGVAVGSDQFVYWDADDPRKNLSPDLLVKRGALNDAFPTWKVWERGAPDLAVEFVSDWDRAESVWRDKLARYRSSGVAELVRCDTENDEQPLRIWDRVRGDLVERSKTSPNLRQCATLGLWWIVLLTPDGTTLRLARDREGADLVPTREERLATAAEAAQQAQAAAEAEVEKLRAELARLRGEG